MSTEVPTGHDGADGRGTGDAATRATVVRARLLDRLDLVERAVVVRAGHGYGRTALAAQWAARLRTQGRPVAWTAGPWDGCDAWHVVRDALAAALRDAGSDVPDDASPQTLAAAADAADAAAVLVVDDADDLDDPAAVAAVGALLRASRTLRVLLLTGSRYPLTPTGGQHPVLTAAGGALPVETLTARELAMTRDELREAAAAWGHPLDDNRLARLVAMVGGWPALARTMLDDTRPDDTELATAGAYAFLRDVLLPSIEDTAKLETAMLVAAAGDPTPQTVQVALDAAGRAPTDGDVVDVLLQLERVGFLRRHPSDGGASRWHAPALLREVLDRELDRRHPELAAQVHRALSRAALAAHPPDPRTAVAHACRADDWTLLETCWLSYGPYLLATGGPAVDAAFAAVPDEVAATSSVLAVARATARRGRDDRDSPRDVVLRLMSELGTQALEGQWRSRTPAGRWFGATSALVAARVRGDLPRAVAVVRETELAAARAGVHGDATGRPYWWFLVQAARTMLLADDPGESLELATRAYELASPSLAADVRAAAAAHVALAHTLDGVLVDAERWLVRYVEALDPEWEDVMRDPTADVAEALLASEQLDAAAMAAALSRLDVVVRNPDVTWPFILRARARWAVFFGDPVETLSQLEQVERTQADWLHGVGLVQRLVHRMRAEMLMALGELHLAADVLAEGGDAAWADIPRARWFLLTGDPHAALRMAVIGGRRRNVSMADRVELLVLEAWAAHDAQQAATAVKAFRSARRLADAQGAVRAFAHLPVNVREALVHESGVPFSEEATERLAAAAHVGHPPVELVSLTPRERTVLALLNAHSTSREVADALDVSVNTVRKQVLSIYGKLGVHDRESALRRGHELGVLGAHAPRPARNGSD